MASGPQDHDRLSQLDPQEREALEYEVSFFEKVLQTHPCQLDTLRALAENYTRLGLYHDGLQADRLLSILAPDDAAAFYNLACSQALTGEAERALDTLAHAWKLGYREREHMWQDEDLVSLRDDPRFAEIIGLTEHDGGISKGQSNA
ncbi:MAG: hypothetical protein JXA52_07345 [Planctomycetes bacterium]|nr:hypothetical protein [Planctomycetota bacterium]